MTSITKNRISNVEITNMIQKAFVTQTAVSITELTEGFFNVAYLIELTNGNEVILKIAPPKEAIIMSHEKNIMLSEVQAMRLVAEQTDVPVASVLFYDNSHDVCEVDFFFMDKLPGRSYNSLMNELSDTSKQNIDVQIGHINSQINKISGEKFGYFGQLDKQGTVWFEVFKGIVEDTIQDANRLGIDLHLEAQYLIEQLDRDKPYFDEVTEPCLVHWDLWAGNIFIEHERVTGIIDFERCLWADKLMEVGFRTFANKDPFMKGYGIHELTDNQKIRAEWYDMYLFLISALECDYRKYEDRGVYNWAIHMIKESFMSLRNNHR